MGEARRGSGPDDARAPVTGWSGTWPSIACLRNHVHEVHEVHGLEISEAEARRCGDYLGLLERWAARFNLVSARSREEVVERHLVDSFSPLRVMGESRSLADVGSGAGFPGVPIAIARPAMRVVLIEPRRHRANFLREVARRLALENVSIEERRAEELGEDGASFEALTGRAIRFHDLVAFAGRLLVPGGRLIAMAKRSDAERLTAEGYELDRSVAYRLRDAEEHVVVSLLRRCST